MASVRTLLRLARVLDFDLPFIRDLTLRESLERDLTDIRVNWENKRWKPVIVASGSVMEALLLDALLLKGVHSTTTQKPKAVEDCMLGDLIDEAERQMLIHSDNKHVATAIKNYRNLIHPGRELRLKVAPTEATAHVAIGLLNSIVDEVKNSLNDHRRLNAQELMAKARSTPDGVAVLEALLVPMWEVDRLAIAKDLVPTALLDGEKETASRAGGIVVGPMLTGAEQHLLKIKADRQIAYVRIYGRSFESLQDINKQICLAALADRVRRSGERHVRILMVNLFHAEHLRFSHDDDRRILASAAAHELESCLQLDYWSSCSTILPHLNTTDIMRIAPGACRCAFNRDANTGAPIAKEFLRSAYHAGDAKLKSALLNITQSEDTKREEAFQRRKNAGVIESAPKSLTDFIVAP